MPDILFKASPLHKSFKMFKNIYLHRAEINHVLIVALKAIKVAFISVLGTYFSIKEYLYNIL